MLFCTSCGTPTGGEAKKFCTKCGAVLLQESAEPEPQTALTTGPPLPEPPTAITPPPGYEFPPAGPSQPGPSWPQPEPPWAQPAPPYPPPEPSSPPQEPPWTQPAPPYPQQEPSWTQPAPPYPQQEPSWTQPAPPYPQQEPSWTQPAPPYPPQEPPGQPEPGRTTMWIAVAVAAVLVLGGGGFAAWKFLGHHSGATGAPTAGASQAGSGTTPASGPTAAATASAPAQPTPSAAAPGSGGGFPVAATAAAAAQPGEQQVVSFVQSYFTAINNHDYGRYASLVTSSVRPTLPQFQSGFGSTADSKATLTGLAATGNGVAAALKFTSHQQPSASPSGTSCDVWHITLFLRTYAGGYRIGPAPPGYHAHFRPC